jgi:DNA-binding CsgD family transcriptional regulator
MTNNHHRCRCGMIVTEKIRYRQKHESGTWHQQHRELRRLRALGLGYAEIGRQLGLTRAYVQQLFKKLERR